MSSSHDLMIFSKGLIVFMGDLDQMLCDSKNQMFCDSVVIYIWDTSSLDGQTLLWETHKFFYEHWYKETT